MRFLVVVLLIIIVSISVYGMYYYLQKYKPSIDKYQELVNENKTLAEYISKLRQDQMRSDSFKINESDSEIGIVDSTEIFDNVSGSRITLESENLFDAGGYTLNKKGRGLLRKTGEVLLKNNESEMVIECHTDNQKIGPSMVKIIPSNWELSAFRAINVMRFLCDSLNVDEKRISVSAYGDSRPIADNGTEEGRRKNRRIEIFFKNPINPKMNEDTIE